MGTQQRSTLLIGLLISSLLTPVSVLAEKPDTKSKPHKQTHNSEHSDSILSDSTDLASITLSALTAKSWAKQYNIKGFKPLPQGIQKKLARGKPLPPGIAKQVLPQPFMHQLPHYTGYEWRAYGTDLVLVSLSNAIVADVLKNIFD
ncbi:anti-virulence regulator CigR family protein [Plesiomonas sp.]|uniref:anti-virulence regulator CigR family protein n=1 Tax=Plesiomonas sp. TaxID=2486279 RepID=UPI003F2DA336